MLSQQVSQHHRFSWFQVLIILAVLSFGCLGVWSTEVAAQGKIGIFIRHLVSIGLGLTVFFAVSLYGYRRLQTWGPWFYLLLLALLLGVLFFGPVVAGSRRWFYLAGISFQPSELAKLVLLLTLASHLAAIRRWNLGQGLLLSLHILLPCALIFRQPDLGMTLMLFSLLLSLLLVSPASTWVLSLLLMPVFSVGLFFWHPDLWRMHLALGALGLLAWWLLQRWQRQNVGIPALFAAGLLLLNLGVVSLGGWAWQHLHPYQQQRLLTFVSPEPDSLSSGYQVIQSTIAVGAGGLSGQGLFKGSQTQLGFVPEQHTDFIFSALAEETGFLGAGLLLCLFALLIARVLWIGFQAQEPVQLYICTGVVALMTLQILINVGMNMDLMPVKGVPLPLVSYGGSSIIIQLALLGLVESVHLQQQRGELTPELDL